MTVHKDEALWLAAEQQAEWVDFKKQVGGSQAGDGAPHQQGMKNYSC